MKESKNTTHSTKESKSADNYDYEAELSAVQDTTLPPEFTDRLVLTGIYLPNFPLFEILHC
jgi:hypothetical protein